MRAGDRAVIYADVFTQGVKEGVAVLIEPGRVEPIQVKGNSYQWWQVQFEGEDTGPFGRWVCAANIIPDQDGEPGPDPTANYDGGIDLWQLG